MIHARSHHRYLRSLVSRCGALAIAAAVGLSLPACKKSPDATPATASNPVDASTPKKAAIAFATAMETGDMATMQAVASGTTAEFADAKNLGQVMLARKRFEEASIAKFGEEGKLPPSTTFSVVGDLEKTEEKIDGDSAQLLYESGDVLQLKKTGDSWKLNLAFLDRDKDAKEYSDKLPQIALTWDQLMQDLNGGKYETGKAAVTDMKLRISRVVLGEVKANQMAKERALLASVTAARADISNIETQTTIFQADTGDYPTSLTDLVTQPTGVAKWKGPYLAKLPKDPWGHPYIYGYPGVHNPSRFDLHSMGPEGKEGAAGQIDNWSSN